MSDLTDKLTTIIAALGIGAAGGAGAHAALVPTPPGPVSYCASDWRETTERVPAGAIPGVTQARTLTTCASPDGKIITLDSAGNVANAIDANGAPLAAPRGYLR